jgi:glycerophosphoryl diester phosphodiesterase
MSSWYAKRPIAHRGLHDSTILENSYEAFENALVADFPIECDVHLTRDNELVIHHDSDTSRLASTDKVIEKSTYRELKALNLKGSDYPIMHLKELLEQCKSKVPLLIELKATQQVRRMAQAIEKTVGSYEGEYALQSFDPFILAGLRLSMPGITLGLLSGTFDDYPLPKYQRTILKDLLLVPIIKPDFIAVEWVRGDERKLLELRKTYPLIAWTVDENSDLAFCRKYFDNIIFENLSNEQLELK